ncbi:hypothetical protein EDB86DRAFT_3103438 [Lactarius hatsudake]|nr:hypothetical protein EDB86DRAFT_3103438 [Lactarius hatsudake]
MNSRSDSDSFDEGDVTARDRKAKGKCGSCANETKDDGAPPPVPNTLPPFFFSAPELFYIQNFLQAITIAAALRALLPTSVPPLEDLLLLASVNEENGAEDARLINLADELVRTSSLVDGEAGKLRAAVARTVRATDPVFLHLQRRLT